MSNHLHFAMVAGAEPLGSWTKRVNSPFANWLNARHGRLGPVFADRPAVFAARPGAEGLLIAYIHNNPVRAGIAARARDSHWTSHPSYVGARLVPSWLQVEQGLARCGVEAAAFDAWVAAETATNEAPNLRAISRAARVRGALHVATPVLSPTDVPLVARHFGRIRPDPREVLHVVAQVTGVPMAAFASRQHARTFVDARRIAVHAGKLLGLTGSDIAAALGVGRQTASRLAASECEIELRAMIGVVVRRFVR